MRPDHVEAKRQKIARATQARQARVDIAKRKQLAYDVPAEKLALVCMSIPGAAGMLNIKAFSFQKAPVAGMIRLAMTPRVRGSGAAVAHVRKLQNQSAACVGKTALDCQRVGLSRWLQRPCQPDCEDVVKGLTFMWDEAAQKTRAILGALARATGQEHKLLGSAPKDVHVQVVLAGMYQVVHDEASQQARWTWQPWLCPPLFVLSTRARVLLEGLERVLPLNFRDQKSLSDFCKGSSLTLCTMTHDMASSNVSAVGVLTKHIEESGPACDSFLMHAERCLTHCIHIAKSACLSLSGNASMLYSLSRMLANNQALHNLIKAMRKNVEQNLIIKRAVAPTDDTMFNVILGAWGIDEDTTLLKSESGSSLLSDIKTMCQVSRFDPETKKWIFFAPPSQVNGAIDRGAAVDAVLDPIVRALLGRRWETAALSRWTGVMSTLKRMLLGTLWNNILPSCLSGLSASMGITEEKVKSMMEEACKAVREGQPVDQSSATSCARVLKLSVFFQDEQRSWQLGIILLCAGVADRLHWSVIGAPSRGVSRLDLSGLVDPQRSAVAKTMQSFLLLMETWQLRDGSWSLLKYLGLSDESAAAPRQFAASAVLQLAAAMFMKAEMRLSSWPYRLQVLLSENVSREDKVELAQAFVSASGCCLGHFGRRLRKHFGTVELVLSPRCLRALRMWEVLQRFSTCPVEVEHAIIKHDVQSKTSGVSLAPVAFRSVCRHLNAAHVQKGGSDAALPLRGKMTSIEGTGCCLGGFATPLSARPTDLALDDQRDPAASAQALVASPASIWQSIGGGNPLIMYMNHRLRCAAQAKEEGAMTKLEVAEAQATAKLEFEQSAAVQARWRELFALKAAKRKVDRRTSAGQSTLVVREPDATGDQVWPEAMHAGASPSSLPISEETLHQYKPTVFPSTRHVMTLVQDEGPFVVSGEEAPSIGVDNAWGCGNHLHNACKRSLVDGGYWRLFFVGEEQHLQVR